jgi:hypothetical protein
LGLNESLIVWGILLIIITRLVWMYAKQTDKQERYIGWKMIGYYLLGTFTFWLDELMLPIGIFLFLVLFLPKLTRNKQPKKWAAYLGTITILSNAAIDYSIALYYEKNLVVEASSDNVYEMDFTEDYEKVKKALKAEDDLAITGSDYLSFLKDGEINQYYYHAYFTRDSKRMRATIHYNDGKFMLQPYLIKADERTDRSDLLSAPVVYLQALEQHGLKKMAGEGDLFHLSLKNSKIAQVDIQDPNFLYTIEKNGIIKMNIEEGTSDEQTKITTHINITAMKKVGEGSYESIHNLFYTISGMFYE